MNFFQKHPFPWHISCKRLSHPNIRRRVKVDSEVDFYLKCYEALMGMNWDTLINIDTADGGLFCGSASFYLQKWAENKFQNN
jgi:hypothetical protein